MKTLFEQYKPFLLFLGKFFLSYLLLTIFYRWYLFCFQNDVDVFTTNVSYCTESLLKSFGQEVKVIKDAANNQYQLFLDGKYLARIIEGCNAISVIILFAAFVIGFSGRIKSTLFFLVIGSVLIYLLNIIRIAVLVVLVSLLPEYTHFLHGVLFPAIIYGIVFLLWLFWIKNYSKYASKSS